jgi:hypothetical protein
LEGNDIIEDDIEDIKDNQFDPVDDAEQGAEIELEGHFKYVLHLNIS